MPDAKISELQTATPAGPDLLPFVDVSDTTMGPEGSTRKATVSSLPFDSAGAAAAAVAAHVAGADPHGDRAYAAALVSALADAYQPLDSDLTAIAALSTTAFGRALLTLLDAAAARAALGLAAVAASGAYFDLSGRPAIGTVAALNAPAAGNAAPAEVVLGTDTRLIDARAPTAHTHPWSQITDRPTTLAGYGITDGGGAPGGSSGQFQWNNGGAFGGAAALTYAASGTHLLATAQGTGAVPLAVRGATGQTAALQQWRTSGGTVLAAIDAAGYLTAQRVYSTGLVLGRPYQTIDDNDDTRTGQTFDLIYADPEAGGATFGVTFVNGIAVAQYEV